MARAAKKSKAKKRTAKKKVVKRKAKKKVARKKSPPRRACGETINWSRSPLNPLQCSPIW